MLGCSPSFLLPNTTASDRKGLGVGQHIFPSTPIPPQRKQVWMTSQFTSGPTEAEDFCYLCSRMPFKMKLIIAGLRSVSASTLHLFPVVYPSGMVSGLHPNQQQILFSENCSLALSLKQLLERGLSFNNTCKFQIITFVFLILWQGILYSMQKLIPRTPMIQSIQACFGYNLCLDSCAITCLSINSRF